jgi:signal transduction histidine kinase
MEKQISDLLQLARTTREDLVLEEVSLTRLAREVGEELRERNPGWTGELAIDEGMTDRGDPVLLRLVLENLVGNAWKYSRHRPAPLIEFTCDRSCSPSVYSVRDNGTGFDPAYADRIFEPFQRLHGEEFEGNGIGLAIAQRIIERHGGRITATGSPDAGAIFFFTLTSPVPAAAENPVTA